MTDDEEIELELDDEDEAVEPVPSDPYPVHPDDPAPEEED